MASWSEFTTAAPSLAAAIRAALHQYGAGLGYLATIRPDGGPRIHPVSPAVVGGGLYCCLLDTPKRVEQSLRFLTSGYAADVDTVLNNALFTVDYNEMVIVRDIDFYSLCEHHLLPFFGRCHVAYIPQGRVLGLSKIPRLVEIYARRLQVQERLTNQIAETLREKVRPMGVAVVMEASHLCMSMRGVEKQNSVAVTSAMLGVFRRRRWI